MTSRSPPLSSGRTPPEQDKLSGMWEQALARFRLRLPGYPTSVVYAIEKTAAGTALIEQNCRRFQVENVISIHGSAPEILHLPVPNRILSAVAVAT